jgi:Na+-translocating ferredoxin:NAD+ oxidoreductase RNF subunit RnfB
MRGRPGLLRLALPVLAASLCAGCGLAGTAVATGTGAAAEVQEAQQAKQTEDRVKRELDQAQQAAAQQRNDAESQGK